MFWSQSPDLNPIKNLCQDLGTAVPSRYAGRTWKALPRRMEQMSPHRILCVHLLNTDLREIIFSYIFVSLTFLCGNLFVSWHHSFSCEKGHLLLTVSDSWRQEKAKTSKGVNTFSKHRIKSLYFCSCLEGNQHEASLFITVTTKNVLIPRKILVLISSVNRRERSWSYLLWNLQNTMRKRVFDGQLETNPDQQSSDLTS